MRIVLAEDNPADVYLLREALKEHGLAVELHSIDDGEAAMDYFERLDADDPSSRPDAILLDLNLPKIDGETILRQIVNDRRYRNVPVAVLSSSASPVDRDRVMAMGASRFILKPTGLDDFLRIGVDIRDMCEEARLG